MNIPASAIIAARKLLTRIHFERLKLPVLTHVLATIDAAGLTLAVSDLDHWLETRLPASTQTPDVTRFLIPAAAIAAAARGDKGSFQPSHGTRQHCRGFSTQRAVTTFTLSIQSHENLHHRSRGLRKNRVHGHVQSLRGHTAE
ncbi:MAG: hypothetical protein WCK77_19610 [Verrucomicrobiota bacterium]